MSEPRITGWKRLFMWDFPRGSVAYDIKVGAILAFIFLTPASFFRDQPTLDKAKENIVMLPPSGGAERYWLESSVVDAIPEAERAERLSSILSSRTGRAKHVVSIDTMQSAEGAIHGYVVIAEP
ncbi:MAG: hypothetical protein LC114_07125 [Bryobacterales bacterium]|nr:hypothetical protein [Bryobacterales bacterium]